MRHGGSYCVVTFADGVTRCTYRQEMARALPPGLGSRV
jgi:prepilin-type processing-associated H-X9-DG protein